MAAPLRLSGASKSQTALPTGEQSSCFSKPTRLEQFSRNQLAKEEEEMQKRCDEKLGKFDTNFLIATPADAFKKPAQRSTCVRTEV